MPLGGNETVVVPLNGVFVPISLPSIPTPKLYSKSQQFYRYQVRGKNWGQSLYWDDFVIYEIGSCVAFRADLSMMVPAAPGACE